MICTSCIVCLVSHLRYKCPICNFFLISIIFMFYAYPIWYVLYAMYVMYDMYDYYVWNDMYNCKPCMIWTISMYDMLDYIWHKCFVCCFVIDVHSLRLFYVVYFHLLSVTLQMLVGVSFHYFKDLIFWILRNARWINNDFVFSFCISVWNWPRGKKEKRTRESRTWGLQQNHRKAKSGWKNWYLFI